MDDYKFFDHNGFKIIDDTIISECQSLAEDIFNNNLLNKSNCVIVFKENDELIVNVKRDYKSALKTAKMKLESGINSIIYMFADYPRRVKHHIITENPISEVTDYEGRGSIYIKDVSDL